MVDLTGTRFNFTATAGIAEPVCFAITKLGVPLDVSGSTWQAHVYKDGERQVVACEHGVDTGEVILTVPALAAGVYTWELVSVTDNEDVSRVLYGELTVVSSEVLKFVIERAKAASMRVLQVGVPDAVGAVLELRWRVTSLVLIYLDEAKKAAEEAKAAAAEIGAIEDRCEELLESALKALVKLEALDELLAAFKAEIRAQIYINPETGTWIIAGYDTRVSATGEPGKCPQLSQSGTWLVYENGTWVDTGASALGKDGIDGDTVRRIKVDSVADIPTEGETCNGGFYYYVATEDGLHDAYAWVEYKGSGEWCKVSDKNAIATADIYGLAKLGTDRTFSSGALVGTTPDGGRLIVPKATNGEPGVVRLGTITKVTNGQPYVCGISENEQEELMFNIAQGGALQVWNAYSWQWEVDERGGSAGIDANSMTEGQFYFGLRTSGQFNQSQNEGLTLNPATTDLLAGVFLADGVNDTREAAVLRPAEAKEAFPLKEDVYEKSETYPQEKLYTKDEVESAIASAVAEVKKWVQTSVTLENSILPGTIVFAGCASMSGYLLCNGAEVLRADYPRLFEAIGTKFGTPSDSSKFKLPDLRNRVPQGADGNLGTSIAAGLPNILGKYGPIQQSPVAIKEEYKTGALKGSTYWAGGIYGGGGLNAKCSGLSFDASYSNSIYGKSSTVQPPALALNAFIKT